MSSLSIRKTPQYSNAVNNNMTTTEEVSMLFSAQHHHHHQLEDRHYFESSPAQTKSQSRQPSQQQERHKTINIQQLSPIKSTFSDSYDFQFGHSTPNAHLLRQSPLKKFEQQQVTPRSPTTMTQSHTINTEFEIPLNYEGKKQEKPNSKKHSLIKNLASNILQLNNLSNQTEKLENELRIQPNDVVIQNSLNRMKGEMLGKIDSIHSIEQELAKIDGNPSKTYLSSKRDDATMNEIRQMLKDMIHSSQNTTRSSINHTLTVNKMLEEVEKATAMTAKNLLSTIVRPKAVKSNGSSSDSTATTAFTTTTSSNLSTNALHKIDSLRSQLESENSALKRKVSELEEKFRSFENKTTDMSEVESLKTLIRKTHAQFEAEKQRLINEFEAERHANMDQVQRFKRELETRLSEKENELKDSLRHLQSVIPQEQQSVTLSQTHESSFLTDEEEAIRRISAQINNLKHKIDAKETRKSRLSRQGRGGNDSLSDDTDTRELMALNEQIRVLKHRMLVKGDRLSRLKTTLSNPNLASDKIYLPINHSKIRNSSDEDAYVIKPQKKVAINPEYYLETESEEDEEHERQYSSSPERRYTSSIEIPADQVEAIKLTPNKKQRSKSANPSSENRHVAVCVRNVEPVNELKINLEQSQKQIHELKYLLEEKNRLLAARNSESKQDKDFTYLLKTLEKQDKKINLLKKKLKEAQLHGNIDSDTMSSINEGYEQVKSCIKENLKKIDSNDSKKSHRKTNAPIKDTSIQADYNDIVKQSQPINQLNQSLFSPDQELICNVPEHHDLEDLLHEHKEEIDHLRILVNDFNSPILNKRAEFEALDLAINNRKQVLFDLELEKRRRMGYSDSFSDFDDFGEGRVKFLKDEIACLEATLHKRNKEFHCLRDDLNQARREMMLIKEKKISLEKDIKKLLNERSKLNEEAKIFEKKADKATMELIQRTDEIENAKKLRKDLEEDLYEIKNELNSFLSVIKSGKYEFKSKNSASILERLLFSNDKNIQSLQENIHIITSKHKEAQKLEESIVKQNIELNEVNKIIAKQKLILQNLDSEISTKKCEIDSLRDKSLAYTGEFKNEIDTYQSEVNKLKRQKDELNGDLKKLKQAINEMMSEIKHKNEILASKNNEIESKEKNVRDIQALKEGVVKQVDDLEKKIQDRLLEKNKADLEYEKKQNEFRNLTDSISNHQKMLDNIRSDYSTESNNLDALRANIDLERKILSQLNDEKYALEKKLNSLNNDFSRLNEEYKKREKQLGELNNLTKEKQNMAKKEEDEIHVLEQEKMTLVGDLQTLKDKLKKKKNDLEKFDQANRSMEMRLIDTQNELKKNIDKIKDSKQELDSLQESVQDLQVKVQDLKVEKNSYEQSLNELIEQLDCKKSEFDRLKSNLAHLQKQIQQEQKQLNCLQAENMFEKKTNDNLKMKNKNLTTKIEESELTINRLDEYQEHLEEKDKIIEDLKIQLADRTTELKHLNEAFKKSQQELIQMRHQLDDYEHISINREAILEHDLKNLVNRYENQIEENIREKELLMKKIYTNNKQTNLLKEFDTYGKLDNKQPINNQLLIAEEQRKIREKLQETIMQKTNALEKSKLHTRDTLNSLKSKLHDIELLNSSGPHSTTTTTLFLLN